MVSILNEPTLAIAQLGLPLQNVTLSNSSFHFSSTAYLTKVNVWFLKGLYLCRKYAVILRLKKTGNCSSLIHLHNSTTRSAYFFYQAISWSAIYLLIRYLIFIAQSDLCSIPFGSRKNAKSNTVLYFCTNLIKTFYSFNW